MNYIYSYYVISSALTRNFRQEVYNHRHWSIGSRNKEDAGVGIKKYQSWRTSISVTWFSDEMMPYKHYDIDEHELETLLNTSKLPNRVSDKIVNYMNTNSGTEMKMLKLVPSEVPF